MIAVKPDRIFVRDDKGFTSAGITSGMDLALAMPGGQSQFSERLAHPIPSDSALREVCDEVVAHPSRDHTIPRMAERAALSERHFARLFLAETGTTPGRFVERAAGAFERAIALTANAVERAELERRLSALR